MKVLIICILVAVGIILLVGAIFVPFFAQKSLEKDMETVISLKGRYEGIPELPDSKPINASSLDLYRLGDLAELQQALSYYLIKEGANSYPKNAQEYYNLSKYYQHGNVKLPKDPTTKNDYCYTSGLDGKSYAITTILQWVEKYNQKNNVETPQICTYPEGMKVICSPSQKCYQVKSPL